MRGSRRSVGTPLAIARGMLDSPNTELGVLGENLAVAALEERGYAVIARRHRSRYGEIDIIAEHAGVVVFIEVKLRSTDLFGEAFEAIPPWKRRRIVRVALDYLSRNGLMDRPVRFDVAAIDQRGSRFDVEIIEDAFGEDG